MTTIGELCNRTVSIALGDEPLIEAARRMRDHHVGCLIVVEDRAAGRVPIGILTDRDVVVRVVADRAAELATLRVRDVMHGKLVVARESEPVTDALGRMRAYGVRRAPVVDRDDVLQGIIAVDDLVEHLAGQLNEIARLLHREQSRERDESPRELVSHVGERQPSRGGERQL